MFSLSDFEAARREVEERVEKAAQAQMIRMARVRSRCASGAESRRLDVLLAAWRAALKREPATVQPCTCACTCCELQGA